MKSRVSEAKKEVKMAKVVVVREQGIALGVIETMAKCQPVVSNLCHAVVVDERGSNDKHVEYLMTLKLHQHHHHSLHLHSSMTV